MDDIYTPREDSFLMLRNAQNYAKGRVLDMGTGSGIIALSLAPKCEGITAVDINPVAVQIVKKAAKEQRLNVRAFRSDLFSKVKGKFDLITFNPPYLPSDKRASDVALDGGRHGYEVLVRFLNDLNSHLKPEGIALILFSSLTMPEKVLESSRNNMLMETLLESMKLNFEELYCYKLEKSELLRVLERNGVHCLKLFAKGKRGLVYLGKKGKQGIGVKIKKPESRARLRLENEAAVLRKINAKGIGPKLLFAGKDFIAYKFAEGEYIKDYVLRQGRKDIISALKETFRQCFILDKMKLTKEEMHRPLKHVIIGRNKVTLIDFERGHYDRSPKNVTQFCQFIRTGRFAEALKNKKIFIDEALLLSLAKDYKKQPTGKNFRRIRALLK